MHFIEYTHFKGYVGTHLLGSGSEALGGKKSLRAFHRAKMNSQDTPVNTVGCNFLPKTKLNT